MNHIATLLGIPFMGPDPKFNFFIGANNSGKSTILDLVSRYLPMQNRQGKFDQKSLDKHRGRRSGELRIRVATPKNVAWNALLNGKRFKDDDRYQGYARKLVDWMSKEELIWLEGIPPYTSHAVWGGEKNTNELKEILPNGELQRLWHHLTDSQGGDPDAWIEQLISSIVKLSHVNLPEILIIPDFRRITVDGNESDLSGAGLIKRLSQLQNPELENQKQKISFEKINSFVKTVTRREDARIEIPFSQDDILVHMDGRILPLDSLGTGIHQVILLAAFCTTHSKCIICLEEPELHLHPLLQRRLIEYLDENTENQYLIATHSAAFLDMDGAAIFRVWQDEDVTRLRRAASHQDRFQICTDLGHRASDLLQANAVIWVEGPSDRIYVRHG